MNDLKHTDNSSSEETLPRHDYDGITEEDNSLPRWWSALFVFMILFAIVYTPVVHWFGFLPANELQTTLALAAQKQEQRELELEASGALDKDPVAAGAKYYKTFCVSCHGTNAEGSIGPNLHDNFWIHGPSEDSIRAVITNGVAAKGMPTWGPILGDRKVKALSTYVTSLWNSPLATPGKKPQGTEYDMSIYRKSGDVQAQKSDAVKKPS